MSLATLVEAAGLFTLALGAIHVVLPWLYDVEHALPLEGPPLGGLHAIAAVA